MLRLTRPINALVMLFALALPAWSQTQRYTVPAASVGDDFAAYRQALDSAADSALANVMREAALSSQIVEAGAKTTLPPDTNVLHQFAEQYWNGNDEAVRRAVARVMELRPVLAPILQDEGVPSEIAALVLVESGGQPTALSPKGARGIWQFMPDTARRFGLTIDKGTDDRLDIQKSTLAAARYLRDLHEQFGDWSLALAAYNAGEIVVQRAVSRSGSKDFALLSNRRLIPAETRAYVPAVMAALHLFAPNGLLGGSPTQIRRSQAILYAGSTTGGQQ
ncbi:MAG: lytic transglycosylase domain-containing protein [Acidobacteriia bacterium]|nr:lytic transglycosylase domain-containing protein [Terriglobia bacterium]